MAAQNKDWTSKLAVKKVDLATELLNSGNDALVKAMVERGISDAIQNAVQSEKPTNKLDWLDSFSLENLTSGRRVTEEAMDEIFTSALLDGQWKNGKEVARSYRAMKVADKKAFLEKEELL